MKILIILFFIVSILGVLYYIGLQVEEQPGISQEEMIKEMMEKFETVSEEKTGEGLVPPETELEPEEKIQPPEEVPAEEEKAAAESDCPDNVCASVSCRVDYREAPNLGFFATEVAALCEDNYPGIKQKLAGDGLQPPYRMVFKQEQDNPGQTQESVIYLSSDWFTEHPEDLGAIIHEMAHAVQGYPAGQPFWLTEGIADYIRYWLGYQTDWSYPHCGIGSEHYTSGYWCSAAFLIYIEKTYDQNIIAELNSVLRAGSYQDSFFENHTGKALENLWQECQQSDCVQQRILSYILKGNRDAISFVVEKEINDYLAGLPREYLCNPQCESDQQYELRYLNEDAQRVKLKKLAEIIQSRTDTPDDQARIAISLTQQIPYDWERYRAKNLINRYPYEAIYENKGVCGEKARLTAFLLRELGFGTALFYFEAENHMAAGITCPAQYSYKNTGYCFIEATTPVIITNDQGGIIVFDEQGNERTIPLSSTPIIYYVSEGNSFDSVSQEYSDAKEWIRISKLIEDLAPGQYLSQDDYDMWWFLAKKYGIIIED